MKSPTLAMARSSSRRGVVRCAHAQKVLSLSRSRYTTVRIAACSLATPQVSGDSDVDAIDAFLLASTSPSASRLEAISA